LLEHGAQPNKASLRKQWQRVWSRPDGASTVGAYENGIHRVANSGRRPATSLHLYGPRTGVFDGRDYDPARDFVCDRLELDELAPHPIIQYDCVHGFHSVSSLVAVNEIGHRHL